MFRTLTIELAQRCTWRQRLKARVGHAVSGVFPSRVRDLYKTPLSSPEQLVDKMIMAYLRRRALRENRARFLERLHHDFWEGKGGDVFSANCDHRFEDLFLAKQAQDFRVLHDTWNALNHSSIIEFGCNSGLLLQHLTATLPGVKRAVGIDLNSNQIRANQLSDAFDSRIEFVAADAADWLAANGTPQCLFVSNGGVLEYFRRECLEALLSRIAADFKPAIFFAVEPVADDHDFGVSQESIPFGEELSFSHNYEWLFRSAGFQVLYQRPTRFESWKWMTTIASVG